MSLDSFIILPKLFTEYQGSTAGIWHWHAVLLFFCWISIPHYDNAYHFNTVTKLIYITVERIVCKVKMGWTVHRKECLQSRNMLKVCTDFLLQTIFFIYQKTTFLTVYHKMLTFNDLKKEIDSENIVRKRENGKKKLASENIVGGERKSW